MPTSPPSPLPLAVRLFLPLANFYYWATFSRPATGSLATTWVSPASLYLASFVFIFGIPAAALAAGSLPLPPWPSLILGLFLLFLALCAFAIALVGLSQRVASRPHHAPSGVQPQS